MCEVYTSTQDKAGGRLIIKNSKLDKAYDVLEILNRTSEVVFVFDITKSKDLHSILILIYDLVTYKIRFSPMTSVALNAKKNKPIT